ncbi:MAG: T9SS type B sorting domain-containing protein [Paludibacteraceae bacterium]|nr:T9SS type B sorting domain-containing protein [Paludibacteraceae bacterium]
MNCAACVKAEQPEIIGAEETKVTLGKEMKEVNLCLGEIAHLSTENFVPSDPEEMGVADPTSPHKYIATWHKGSKTAPGVKGIGYTDGDDNTSLNVTYEDADIYYLKVIDFDFPGADGSSCYMWDSVKVIANPVPEKTLAEVKPFCEGTLAANEAPTLTIEGYKLHWYEDADTTKATKEPSVIDKKADEYEYFYVLEDSKTGCKGEVNPFAFTVNPIPEAVKGKDTIDYIRSSGSVSIEDKAKENGVVATGTNTIFWSESPENDGVGVKKAPMVDVSKEDKAGKEFYYFQKNEETGCYSEKSKIVVVVNDSPKPSVKDTVVCVGKAIADLSSLVKKESKDYELLWYASASDAKEDGVTTPASLTEEQAATPGEYKFYVAQKNTITEAISEKAVVTVTVVGVDKPKVEEKAIYYCANDVADDLENNVIKTEDASKFLYQDGFQWFVKDAESEEFIGPAGSKPEVNTSVQATVPVTYGVRQVYTIPSTGEQCIGADIEDFTVKTTFLDKPTVLSSIDYMKDDINASNSFDKNILTQNSSAVKHNSDANEFIWYDSEGTLIGKGGEGDAFSPTPKSDPNKANNGIDQSFTYLVSQTDGKCESEKATVEVNILATPKPNTKNVELCEGQLEDEDNGASVISIKDLVDINTDKPGTTKDDFVLVWYDKDDKPISEPVLSSEMSEADGVEKTIIYKVSQKPVAGGAESAKSTIEVTVKARAKLDPAYLPNVCETTVDLKDGWVVANDVKIALKVEYTDAEGTKFSSDKSVVNKSEVYSVTASFDVVTLDKPAYACISNMEKIDVKIDTLQDVKIVGTETTCPNTAAEELKVELYENVDDATIKYKWSGKIDEANAVKKEDVSTEILEGVAGDKFDFTVEVTAGTCTKTSPKHTITLGDGPVVGSIKFTEAENTDLEDTMKINVSSGKATLYTCGTDLTMDPTALENTKADFKWTVAGDGSPVGSSASAKVNPTEKTVYRVTYTNKCSTSVDITVIPVPLTVGGAIVGADICENESASIDAQIQCVEKPESIKWSRNGEAVSKYDGEGKLVFEPAKPEDSGEYTCVVTNRACVRTIEPLTLLVKPYVKFAPEKEEYVVRRGETVNIINTITVPSDAVPAEITWTDNGKAVENSGKDYSVEVTKDMNLNVEMTEEGKYCPSDADIIVKVDAVLQLAGEISDANMGEDGNYKMCLGETKTLVIDTTGTGKFVYPEKMSLTVTESQAGGSSRVLSNGTLNSDGKLEFKISPSTDATYSVSFVYREGEGEDEQIEELEIKITVLQKIEVKVPNGLEVCEGEEVEIALESVTPKGTVITWEDETIEGGKAEGETVVAKPTFSKPANGGHVSTYTYTAYASFDICETAEFPVKVKVNEPLTGELEDVTICENETARLDASSYKATSYIWTSDELETERSGQGITVTPKSTAVFKVSMERGGCKAEDELTVTVNPNPLILQVDSLSYRKIAVVVDATHNGKLTYRIDDGAESSFAEFDSLAYAPHVAYVTDEYGCSSSFDFMINAPLIIPNKWLSPNGDGETDRWEVPAISETYPDAKIVIYDRFGKKLIEYKGSDPGWDGVYNGQLMPTTDYWYEITVHEIDKVYTGHFTLLRR